MRESNYPLLRHLQTEANKEPPQERYYIYDCETYRLFTTIATSTDEATKKFVEWDMKGDPETIRDIIKETVKTGWIGYAQDRSLMVFKAEELEDIDKKEAK